MTLRDHESQKDIINPYITLYHSENCWVALNTDTFREAQRELIHPNSEDIIMHLKSKAGKRLYKVIATVGKQDHPFDWDSRKQWTRGVRVEGIDDAVAIIPIGYLLDDVVEELFPKTFAYFEQQMNRSKNKD